MLLHGGCGGRIEPMFFTGWTDEEPFITLCLKCSVENPDPIVSAYSLSRNPYILLTDSRVVYVGRANRSRGLVQSPWANLFVIGRDGDRQEVIAKYQAYAEKRLIDEPTWLDPLVGKDMACWCAPEDCHIMALAELTYSR